MWVCAVGVRGRLCECGRGRQWAGGRAFPGWGLSGPRCGGEPPPSEWGTCGPDVKGTAGQGAGEAPSPREGSASLDAMRKPWGIRLEVMS